MSTLPAHISSLRALAQQMAERAYVPYTLHHVGAVLVLSDGTWIPGVRVENASFPLMISAPLNALTSMVALDRKDIVYLIQSESFTEHELIYLKQTLTPIVHLISPDLVAFGNPLWPTPQAPLSPKLIPTSSNAITGIEKARAVARRALTPFSDFPVGCVVETTDGVWLPGCNVEHPDWNRTLCAERNALSLALSYGHDTFRRIYVSCFKDPTASPCGACRQVLAELAPNAEIIMDRGEDPPEITTPDALLPGSFTGETLRKTKP